MLTISNIFKYNKYCPYIEYIEYIYGRILSMFDVGYRSLTHRRSSCCATQRPQQSPPEEYH